MFLPAKLKEVYLYYLLEHLEDHKVYYIQPIYGAHIINQTFNCSFGGQVSVRRCKPKPRLFAPILISCCSKCVLFQLIASAYHRTSASFAGDCSACTKAAPAQFARLTVSAHRCWTLSVIVLSTSKKRNNVDISVKLEYALPIICVGQYQYIGHTAND